jgi:2'-hydroxyisoflavone reductase
MNILIIGGTRFQGRYLVDELLNAGHAVTVFHRGGHTIHPRKGLLDIIGDRNTPSDLARLSDYEFDTCIDTCAYFPAQITVVADILKIRHYCLISSVYVYADRDTLLDENSPRSRISSEPPHELTQENYGPLKALCEEAVLACFGNTSLILRPSIIIGTGDHTERLLFWMRLAALHGKRLDVSDRPSVAQLIDVRDLARFTTRCIAMERQGAVNVCGEPASLADVLNLIEEITGRPLESKSVLADALPGLGLERLPYLDTGHLARHATSLSHAWGFTGRDLRGSLTDIYADSLRQGFAMHNFLAEEAVVLALFA